MIACARAPSASPASTMSTRSGAAGASGLDGGLRTGGDDTDQRNVEALAGGAKRGGGGRVAGDPHQLGVEPDEVIDDAQGEIPDLVLVARTVGKVGQVLQL